MTKVFPSIIVGLMVCASVVYAVNKEWKLAVYFFSAATLNLMVIL